MDTSIPPSIFDDKHAIIFININERDEGKKVRGHVKINGQHEFFTSLMTYHEMEAKGEQIRTELCDILFEFAATAPTDRNEVEARLRNAKVLGRELARNLFGGEQIPQKIATSLQGFARPRIEVMSEDFSLPWDLLNNRDAKDTFYEFWGMKAIINRSIQPRLPHSNEMGYEKSHLLVYWSTARYPTCQNTKFLILNSFRHQARSL